MTKRQLIKWLEAKREEAIGEVCRQATDTLNTRIETQKLNLKKLHLKLPIL